MINALKDYYKRANVFIESQEIARAKVHVDQNQKLGEGTTAMVYVGMYDKNTTP